MRKVNPYVSVRHAIATLDNGGRFYNLLTKANDGQIEASELAKVAGVFNDKSKMFLYLEMMTHALSPEDKSKVISSISDELRSDYLLHQTLSLSQKKS